MKFINIRTVVGVVVVLVGFWLFAGKDSYTWHQKLTIVVETPNGEVSGSSVNTVIWGKVNWRHRYPASFQGEATVADLGQGKFLFALIGDETKFLAFRTFDPKAKLGEELFARMEKLRSGATVPTKYYPRLVTFKDINDPASVMEVNPQNFRAIFGVGYELKSVVLEMIDKNIKSNKVLELLPWLGNYDKKQFDGKRLRSYGDGIPFSNSLNSVDFLGVIR